MADRLKVGFVLDDNLDKPDGVQQYVLKLGHWLSTEGHDVHYLVGETIRTDIPNVHSLSRTINVRYNQNRMATPLPANRSRINKLLAAEKFDVLHVQMPYSPLLAARVVRAAAQDVAVVGTFHIAPYSNLVSVSNRILGSALKRSLKRFNAIISVSAAAQAFALKTFHVKSDVLPNVIDIHALAPTKPALPDDKRHIVFLGRLMARKGCQYLLKALVILKDKGLLEETVVHIGGRGPLLAELQAYARQHGLDPYVSFNGFIDETDKANFLSRADIAVFPSTGGESFGYVLVEAMAAGARVVIGGDNPGYRTVLGEHPQQLVNPKDASALAACIEHFLTDDRARLEAHTWQIKSVQQYDVRVVGPHIINVYRQALHNTRPTV